MAKARGRVELVVRVAEPELSQRPRRRRVLRMMSGEQLRGAKGSEGEVDGRSRGLSEEDAVGLIVNGFGAE